MDLEKEIVWDLGLLMLSQEKSCRLLLKTFKYHYKINYMFGKIEEWSYRIGERIKEKDEKLLKALIFDIRGEETPGRFLNKLVSKLVEYKTNRNIGVDVEILPELTKERWQGDKFYYMKAAILSGFLNVLTSPSREKSEGTGGENKNE